MEIKCVLLLNSKGPYLPCVLMSPKLLGLMASSSEKFKEKNTAKKKNMQGESFCLQIAILRPKLERKD